MGFPDAQIGHRSLGAMIAGSSPPPSLRPDIDGFLRLPEVLALIPVSRSGLVGGYPGERYAWCQARSPDGRRGVLATSVRSRPTPLRTLQVFGIHGEEGGGYTPGHRHTPLPGKLSENCRKRGKELTRGRR